MLLKAGNTILRNNWRQNVMKFGFSEKIIPLNIRRQKALLSIDVINIISDKPKNRSLNTLSLTQNILKHIKEKQDYQQQSKDSILQLFEKGIKLEEQIFYQERIIDGQITQNDKQLFIFHPTYLVTTQVFSKVMEFKRANKILQGQYGISKTVSVCLFWQLAKFIDEYRFQKNAQITPQMLKIPKIFYFSAAPNINKQNQAKKIILKQCPQIEKEIGKPIFSTQLKILEIYETINPIFKSLKTFLVFDQINLLAKYDRKLKGQKKQGQPVKAAEKNLQYFDQMLCLLIDIKPHFGCIIYLSSVNIEPNFAKQHYLSGDGQAQTSIIGIQYSRKIFEKQTFYSLIDYYLFQLQTKIFKNQKCGIFYNQNSKDEIKQKCLEILQNKKPYFFTTPLDIRLFVTKKNKKEALLSIIPLIVSEQTLINKIVKSFKDLIQSSTDRYSKQLKNHFQKDDKKDLNRKNLMLQLFNELTKKKKLKLQLQLKLKNEKLKSQNQIENKAQTKNQNSDESDTQNKLQEDTIQLNKLFKFNKKQIQAFIDKRLFDIDDIEENKIKLLLPADLITKVLVEYFTDHLDYILKKIKNFLQNKLRQGQYGYLIENLFLLVFNRGDVDFRLYWKESIEQKNLYEDFQIKRSSVYGFLPIQNKTNQIKVNFMDKLKPSLLQMIRENSQCAVILPIKKIYMNEQNPQIKQIRFLDVLNSKSKSIDAIFIKLKKISQYQVINIWAIDFTTSKTGISKKIQKFIEIFLGFQDCAINTCILDNKKFFVQLNYFVLGSQKQIQQSNVKFNLQNSLTTNQITFKIQSQPNILQVNQQFQQLLLKKVGYICLQNGVEFTNADQQAVKQFKAILDGQPKSGQKKNKKQKKKN